MGIFDPINSGELDRNNLPIQYNKAELDIFGKPRAISKKLASGSYETFDIPTSTDDSIQYAPGDNREAVKAGYQSSAELWGKAITQGVSEAVLGTLEGMGYLMDFEQHKNIIQGTETEYGNWFSDVMKKSKEYVNEEIAPVYRTEAAQQGFAPSDGSWWAFNAPSIASAVSLLIPAWGATKAASYLGKAARALGTSAGIASKVDKASDAIRLADKLIYGKRVGDRVEGITQAVFSRYMENTMEASGTYDEYYQKAIASGKDPQLAAKEAGEAASTAWKNNWGNIVFDIGQYMSLTKGLNATNHASKAFRKNLLQKTGLFAGNMAQEGIEEGFQFVVSKEAQRKAEMGNDYEGWKDITKRIEDYSDDPEFKASILLGAFGGGAFTAIGKGIEGISNKIAKNAQRDVVKQKAIDEGDVVTAHKITNEQFTEHAFNQAKEGKLQDTMDTYRKMGESTDEELASKWQMTPEQIKDFRERNPEIQEDLKFYQEKFLQLSDDVRKDPTLLKTELALNFQNRANDKLRQKLAKEESELRSKIGTKLTSEQLQKKILTNKLNSLINTDKIIDRKAFSKLSYGKGTLEYLDKQIKDTKEELERLKDVKTPATSEDSEINKHTEQVSNLESQDAINGIRLEKMQTEEGQKETKDDIMSGFRNQFLATVSEDASLDTLTKAVDTPVFGKDAQSKIDKLAKAANEGATVPSEGTIEEDVRDRYSNSILLFHDLQEMRKNKGITSSNVKDAETFIKEYRSNKKFRDAFNEYFNALSASAVERQMEDVPSPVDNTNEIAAHSEYMDAMPEDVGHSFKADRSIIQNHQYMMYVRKGDDITYFGKKDLKSKKSTIELASIEGYSNLIDDGKIHMLYDSYGDPVLTETNTRTIIDEEGNEQEIVFLTEEDFKVINDPTINLFGEKIFFEIPLDDTYSPTQGKGAEEMVIIPFIEYEGRKVQLGKLRATTKNDGGENIEVIRELRNRIHTEWLQSEVKEGSYIVQKDFGITVGGRTPGHFNITGNGRNKISQVTDTYYLGVLNTKKGKTLIMDNDGASNFGIDKDTQVTHGDLSRWSAMGGKTVLHILTTAGKYVPIGLYTSKLKEQPKAQTEVFKLIDKMFSDKQLQESHIDSDYTKDYIQKLNSNLQEFLSLKISYMPGMFHTISLSGDVDSKKTYHTAQEMKEGFSELIMRINESKLNSNDTYKNGKTYNQYIIDEGWITTNLSPNRINTLGAMVKLDLRNFNEGKLPTIKPKRERATLPKKEKSIVVKTEPIEPVVSNIESKKADIERRRPTSYIRDSKDKKSPLETFRNEAKREWDGVSVITGDRMKNLYVGIQLFVEAYPEHKDLLDKFIKKENGTIGITNNNLSFVLNTLKKQGVTTESELGVKINAKYDAELAKLDNQITPQQKQQAQQLYSQYLDSLNKPNTNPILQGNQQEQVKKFIEFQERLNNKEFLEGAKNVYESTPALQQLGTQEEYNDYIARVSLGIVKNPTSGDYNYTSKVKDIVYHGSNYQAKNFNGNPIQFIDYVDKQKSIYVNTVTSEEVILSNKEADKLPPFRFNKFKSVDHNRSGSNNFLGTGIYFTTSKQDANQNYNKSGLYSAIINVTNAYTENNGYKNSRSGESSQDLINKGYDAVTERINNGQEYNVFEPEQIHILSSKADIQGFKDFMSFENSEFSKYGTYQQFRDYIMSKNFAAIEEFLVVNNKIDRKC